MGAAFSTSVRKCDCQNDPTPEKKPFALTEPKTLTMIGAPLSEGQDWETGVDNAPQELREGGLEDIVRDMDWGYEDVGDLDFTSKETDVLTLRPKESDQLEGYYSPNEVKNARVIGRACEQIYEKVKEAALQGKFVLTVGGDHSLGCPTICGVMQARPNLAVVWVDAHGDCNVPETSPTKNYHGMPAAHVMGWFKKRVLGFDWMDPHLRSPLDPKNIVFIALRDLDPGEKLLLKKHQINAYTMTDIDRLGIAEVLDRALSVIDPNSCRPLHLSFDIDSIDPTVAPGTGTKARGGLTYRESHFICERLAITGRLGSMDMVEINPEVDRRLMAKPSQQGQSPQSTGWSECEVMHGDNPKIKGAPTVRLGIELIESALGRKIL